MTASQIYTLVSIVILAVVAILFFFVIQSGKGKSITPLVALAFGCILAGLLFGKNQWVGFGLLSVGVILAIVDMV